MTNTTTTSAPTSTTISASSAQPLHLTIKSPHNQAKHPLPQQARHTPPYPALQAPPHHLPTIATPLHPTTPLRLTTAQHQNVYTPSPIYPPRETYDNDISSPPTTSSATDTSSPSPCIIEDTAGQYASLFHAPPLHANGEPHYTPPDLRLQHPLPSTMPAKPHIQYPQPSTRSARLHLLPRSTIRRVMRLHKKMGHPPEDNMVQAVMSDRRRHPPCLLPRTMPSLYPCQTKSRHPQHMEVEGPCAEPKPLTRSKHANHFYHPERQGQPTRPHLANWISHLLRQRRPHQPRQPRRVYTTSCLPRYPIQLHLLLPRQNLQRDIFLTYLKKVLRFFTTRDFTPTTLTQRLLQHLPLRALQGILRDQPLHPSEFCPTKNGKTQPSVTCRPSSPVCPPPYTAKTFSAPPNTGHASTTLSPTP